ncbi:heparan N-sulfatase [Persicobacter diffluens]|uniref:Heparan N-sulfatase n=2 Tax=Persicobacter diffluens TaxID=981 RepID=A0AAN4W484_9BACT|nr:heparan N-sulfatase [Persicobacter diffluens]
MAFRLSAQQSPNIVFIVSDDHGTDDLACYGNKSIHTPNLDGLAQEGVRFNRAYATSASCTASRSTLLSGIYNHANGLYGHMHHFHHFSAYEHIQSLPVLLKELGDYETVRVGKYHLHPEHVFRFDSLLAGHGRNSVEMSNHCISFLSERTADQPFLLYYCTEDPHRSGSIKAGTDFVDTFGNQKESRVGITPHIFQPEEVEIPPYLPDDPQTRAEMAEYYQAVARMDQGIGKLFHYLKSADLWENTIIVYLSDNGIAFPGAKSNQYEPALKLPLIVKPQKGTFEVATSNALVSWVDITPTLLDMVGLLPQAKNRLSEVYQQDTLRWDHTASPDFHGKSFKGAFSNPNFKKDTIFASHTFHEITMYYPMRTIITERYKLIWNIAYPLPFPHAEDLWSSASWQAALEKGGEYYGPRPMALYNQRPEFELYDLQEDPLEINNLAQKDAHVELLSHLKQKLKAFCIASNDPWQVKWERQ